MFPSQPVRHCWPLLNQSFFCIFLRSSLLVERFGTDTFFTPFSATAFSPLAE